MSVAKTTSMVIRIPDETGTEVTYEAGGPLGRVLGTTQLSKWAMTGAVRKMVRRNVTFYAVLDAAMLRGMTSQESLALGIRRTPEKYLRSQRVWDEETSRRTLVTADHNHEEWCDYDRCFVIDAYNAGAKLSEIAKALGRTYHSVQNTINILRAEGDLPETGRDKPGWQWMVLGLMTHEERAIFLGRKLSAVREEAAAA